MTPPQRSRMTPPQRKRRHPGPEPPPQPSPHGEQGEQGEQGEKGAKRFPERMYVLTGAAGDGGRARLDLVTLIVARDVAPESASPEQSVLLGLCRSPLSVAELSAYLSLPFSVVTVLLTQLLEGGLVHARAPIVRQAIPDRSLLEAVMHGLQRL